eukprot:2005899-Pyramimonas_sp.AAC.1
MGCNRCGTIGVVQRTWCNLLAELGVDNSAARAIILPSHPQCGLQNPRGSQCDECWVMAGASLWPR